MPKATLLHAERRLLSSGAIMQARIWLVPEPVPPSTHPLKYSLVYIVGGERVVGYDNERGKGDHRHYGTCEEPYAFTTPERLMMDFLADVRAAGGDV
ncbi:hypothetical protein M2352_003678 [Azospirillum fermentarium]|uniref:toxin-antitoxin system TumE family protein n=1 Tax=Azospirillum fermentarium TaxID=1233114 RepID=UPI00222620BB|nr:DUF6516 family protein [Azospirillum fermentarium]MCW2248044.1 hypothetical protein [Azospirillum fermentarium]